MVCFASLRSVWFSATNITVPSGNTPPRTFLGSRPEAVIFSAKLPPSLSNTTTFKPLGNLVLASSFSKSAWLTLPVVAGAVSSRALKPNIKPRSTNSKSSRDTPTSRASCSTSRAAFIPCLVTSTLRTPVFNAFLRSVLGGCAPIVSAPRSAATPFSLSSVTASFNCFCKAAIFFLRTDSAGDDFLLCEASMSFSTFFNLASKVTNCSLAFATVPLKPCSRRAAIAFLSATRSAAPACALA